MIYQFERSEIKRCDGCDFFFGGVDGMSYEWGYCTRHEDIIDGHKKPQENNCPLVAISKTETTSAKKIVVDIQLRPMLDELEVDIDDVKEYISKLKEDER